MAARAQAFRSRQAFKAATGAATSPPRPDRHGKRLLAGHFEPDTYFALHELLAQIGRQTGVRLTVQDAIGASLRLFFQKYGLEIPEELKQVSRPPCRVARPKSGQPDPAPDA